MGYSGKIALLACIILSAKACDEVDMTGMFINDVPVNRRFQESVLWNEQSELPPIDVPDDDYILFSMGDSHVGGTRNLDTLFQRAMEAGAAAVVMAGDLTTGNEADFDKLEAHLPDPLELPTFLMVGNHDLYFDGWEAFHSRFGSSTYHFVVRTPAASDLYICLDTGGGTLGHRQLEWLENILAEVRPDYRRCVVFTHSNLFRLRRTFSTNPLVEEVVVLLDFFSEYQVDMAVTAHDHQHDATNFGNTVHVVMDALKDGLPNAGYLQINVAAGEMDFDFRNLH